MSTPRVDVIVLSWNDGESVRRCLASIASSDWPDLRVLLVDNASTKYDPRTVVAAHPRTALLVNPANLGVAGGRNAGLRAVLADRAAEFILLLDDDTEQAPDMIRRLVNAWDPAEGRAVLGPSIHERESRETVTSLGGGWNGWTGRTRHMQRGLAAGRFLPLDFVIGCCFFTHRSVFDSVGLFDEQFNLYYGEDVDFCLSAARRELRSAAVLDAVVYHRVSHAAGGARFNPRYARNKGEKTVRLMRKHGSALQWATFLASQSLFVTGAAVREGARGNIGAVSELVRGMTGELAAGGGKGAR